MAFQILSVILYVFEKIFETMVLSIVLIAWMLPLVFSFVTLAAKSSHPFQYRLLFAGCSYGFFVVNGYFALQWIGIEDMQQHFLPGVIAACYWFGPVGLLLLSAYVDRSFIFGVSKILHFVPGLIVSGYYLFSLGYQRLGFAGFPYYFDYKVLISIGYIASTPYIIYVINRVVTVSRKDVERNRQRNIRNMALWSGGIFVISTGALASGVILFEVLSPIVPLTLSGILYIAIAVVVVRYPEVVTILLDAIEKAPQRKSIITESVANEIEGQLEVIICVEETYKDSALTLSKLAKKIGVNKHQLSEYLNVNKGLNFSRYINGFRIEDAKNLLIDRPSISILEIAMESGFNSKSSFNSYFSDIVGMTPSVWRKENIGRKLGLYVNDKVTE